MRNWPADSEASGVLDGLTIDDLTYIHRGLEEVQRVTIDVAQRAHDEGDLEKAVQCISRASDMDTLLDRVVEQVERFGYGYTPDGTLVKKEQEVA